MLGSQATGRAVHNADERPDERVDGRARSMSEEGIRGTAAKAIR
jgi:hypothetical protein